MSLVVELQLLKLSAIEVRFEGSNIAADRFSDLVCWKKRVGGREKGEHVRKDEGGELHRGA
jgi:hypothetical protein